MAFSINEKSFWIWLIPDEPSIKKINLLRENLILTNGLKNFHPHITMAKVNSINPILYANLIKKSLKKYNLNSTFKIRINKKNYFNSITLVL